MSEHHTGAEPPLLSIVIPAHNARETIGQQIEALLSQPCPVSSEIVIVDNSSTDHTAGIARSFSDSPATVRVIIANDGIGPSYARNVGVAGSSSPWIAFCDADDVVGPQWLESIATSLETHEFVSGPLELDRLNPPWLAASRGTSFADSPTSFHGLFPYGSSCNLAIRRAALLRAGGFDESLATGEDVELARRLWRLGLAMHFESNQLVHYRLRSSAREIFRQSRSYAAFHPPLLEQLRTEGVDVPSRLSRLRSWAWLLRHVPMVRSRAGRARWIWAAGTQVGWVLGGVRARRLYM